MAIKQYGNLVRLLDVDPDFIIDLVYATADNFTGSVVYDSPECYIDVDTAQRLIAAKNMAKKDGYRMKVWDAFRPTSAQQRFWDLLPDNNFVAYPPDMETITEFKNSHMNGQSVDVTLTDMDGNDIPMPSAFDDFTEKARLDCPTTSGEALKNATYLRDIMVRAGFSPYSGEWWHFYDRNPVPVRYTEAIPR
ncbi:M15 family metallopeptidase [Anaerovoracaceae bacterium 42-11]